MASREMTINVGGQQVRVRPLDFEIKREDWNEYILLDGGTVRVKNTVTQIFQVLDDRGQPVYNDDGQPRLMTQSKNDMVARV